MKYVLLIFFIAIYCKAQDELKEDGKCRIPRFRVMNYGETQDIPFRCQRITCLRGGAYILDSCGTLDLPKNCKRTQPDRNKPFPECCDENFIECN